jgi:uncharacterized protein YceH (UPF0502 family)
MAGRKESRYAHLLGGDVQVDEEDPQLEPAAMEVRAENERIGVLEQELQKLRSDFDELRNDLQKFKREFE